MPKTQVSNSRKRQHSEQPALPQNKRRKPSYPSNYRFPPAFWDDLSKVHLTRLALKELNRRNTQAIQNTQYVSAAELKNSSQALKPPAEYLGYCGAVDLKNIKQTARHGGPDLTHLRNLPHPPGPPTPAMSSTPSSSRGLKRTASRNDPSIKPTTKTASSGPYNKDFGQHLIDNRVYPEEYEYPDGRIPALPANWEEIKQRLSRRRSSLSPSRFTDNHFRQFRRENAYAKKEQQVVKTVIPIIEGTITDTRCVSGDVPFTNLDPLTSGKLVVAARPDIYHGARPEQLDRRVRDELSGYIIPSTQEDLPITPNFFLEVKGPDGTLAVAARQASYNGSLGARGMYSLQSYQQEEPVPINTASTISSIYSGGLLMMYTIHLFQPTSSGIRPEYFMHQLTAVALIGDPESFRRGAAYYRNAADWAKEQRDEAIRQANGNNSRVLTVTTITNNNL